MRRSNIRTKRIAAVAANGSSASATGATEITFTVLSELTYAGVEWGVSPDYVWSSFDAEVGTSRTIVINATDGVAAATTYVWRAYTNTDPLDGSATRAYIKTGTVTTA